MPSAKPIVIMGAGPAGLTAAWRLIHARHDIVVWEADTSYVGGLARTVQAENYRIDVGGHLFFSKAPEVSEVWKRILVDDFVKCTPLSRIYDQGRFFNFAEEGAGAFRSLGLVESARIRLGMHKARIKPIRPETTLAQWAVNRLGERLSGKVFRPLAEKILGVSCDEAGADLADMRLDGMSLAEAFATGSKPAPREFFYPRLGPGQMWEAAANKVIEKGGPIFLDRKVQTIHWDETGVTHVTGTNQAGEFYQQEGSHFLSSMPLKDLMLSLDPPPPKEVAEAARSLRHRALVTVCLIINRETVFPDTWIYVPDRSVKFARVQNYKNYSAAMVPNSKETSLGLEYYCSEGDVLWNSTDFDLAQVGIREAVQIGLVKEGEIKDAFVVRMPRALPVFDQNTQQHRKTIREWVSLFANLQPLGRNGLHCCANQDHAMMTSMLAVKNIQGGDFDCWKVTPDALYPQPQQAKS